MSRIRLIVLSNRPVGSVISARALLPYEVSEMRPERRRAFLCRLELPTHISQDRGLLLQSSNITRPSGLPETSLCQGWQCPSPRTDATVERAVTIWSKPRAKS